MKEGIIVAPSSVAFCKRWGNKLFPLLRSHLIAGHTSLDLQRKVLTVNIPEILEIRELHGLNFTPFN